MKLAIVFLGLCLQVTGNSFAQPSNQIRGKITDAASGQAIAGCSVFINSTSKGTTSSSAGEFELHQVPVGNYELIVSSVGYETFVFPYGGKQMPLNLAIQLKRKSTELSAITVEPYDKDGWQKWGKVFTENFIGKSDNALQCRIKNPEALRFSFSNRRNKLKVVGDDPLIIENDALGYDIKYALQEFSIDYNNKVVLYLGYPLFVERITSHPKRQQHWQLNRHQAYLGSLTHFMRTLYANDFEQEGFQLRRRIQVPNLEKQRVLAIYKLNQNVADTFQVLNGSGTLTRTNQVPLITGDSLRYYQWVLLKPDTYPSLVSVHSADSLLSGANDFHRSLFFTDTLFIIYVNPQLGAYRQSQILLTTPSPITLEPNGHYYPPTEILTLGFWAGSEKIANMLPLDYP
jgi:CarboxypepD_reg-like domain